MNTAQWNNDILQLKLYSYRYPIQIGIPTGFVVIKTRVTENLVSKKQINKEVCFIYSGRAYSSIEELDSIWGIEGWRPTNNTRYKHIMEDI